MGNWYYYAEHLAPNHDVAWWSHHIFETERSDNWGGPDEFVSRRLIGPEAQQRAQTDGKTVLDLFQENGVYAEPADRSPASRISKVTELLRPSGKNRHPFTGESPAPRLYVFNDCKKLLEYIPQYRWVPVRVSYTEEDAPERPRKKDDHNIDNLGHIVVAAEKQMFEADDRPPHETIEMRIKRELDESLYEEGQTRNRDLSYHPELGRVA